MDTAMVTVVTEEEELIPIFYSRCLCSSNKVEEEAWAAAAVAFTLANGISYCLKRYFSLLMNCLLLAVHTKE
jgi:hypothetical protein